MRKTFLCVCIIGGLAGGCSPNSSDIRPLQSGIAAAVTLGQTSTLAMQAMAASSTYVCAAVKTGCSANYPCNGAVTVTYGSGCPLPLGGEASGTVEVSGSWQTQGSATLSDTFVGVQAGNRSTVVVNASNLTVTRSMNDVSARYTWQNVNVQSGVSTLSGQSSWTVDVDFANTPDDPSDDIYHVTGADQGVSTQVAQISANEIVVDPSCRKNPISGSATIQKVSTTSIIQSRVSFHSACDGKADVDGDSVALDFLH
jgi:hypothetical protein